MISSTSFDFWFEDKNRDALERGVWMLWQRDDGDRLMEVAGKEDVVTLFHPLFSYMDGCFRWPNGAHPNLTKNVL